MNLRDLMVDMGAKQEPIVSDLIKRHGIIETAEFGYSSDFLKHEFPIMTDDGEASVRAVNGSIVASSSNEIMASVQLAQIQRLEEVDQRIARKYNGLKGYLARPATTRSITRKLMQVFAQAIIYGDDPTFGVSGAFKGLHQIAKANGMVIAQKGGTTGHRSTLFAVRWAEDENQIVLPEYTNGDLIQLELLADGNLMGLTADTTTKARYLKYGATFWIDAALAIASKASVAAITQIDSSHIPTATEINQLIDAVEGNPDGKTFLYTNRSVRTLLGSLKDGKLRITPGEKTYSNSISDWDGFDIVVEAELLKTETTALD